MRRGLLPACLCRASSERRKLRPDSALGKFTDETP
jgi:hypothetical protein